MRLASASLLLLVCCHDWDKLDPRLGSGGAGAGGSNVGGATTGGQGPGAGGSGAGSPCGVCPVDKPLCDPLSGSCVECLEDAQCSGLEECKDDECCIDDGLACGSDDDCCGSAQCQDSGACGEFAGCLANGDTCGDDAECCSDKCTGNTCRKD